MSTNKCKCTKFVGGRVKLIAYFERARLRVYPFTHRIIPLFQQH